MHRREFILKSLVGTGLGAGALGIPTLRGRAWAHPEATTTILHNGIVLPDPFPPRLDRFMDGSVSPPYLLSPPEVISIDVGRQLFVDDFLIGSADGISRKVYRPVVDPNPLISPQYGDSSSFTRPSGETVLTHFAAPYSDGVWWDAYQGRYRAWLLSGLKALAHAESADGVEWHRTRHGSEPAIIQQVFSGRDSGTVWIDFEAEDPAERYKMSHFNFADKKNWLYASRDGLTWPEYDEPIGRTAHYVGEPTAPIGDRTTFFRDPFRRKWVWSLRNLVDLRAIGGRQYNRVRMFAEADDLLREPQVTGGSIPWLMQRLDLMPEVQPQLYNVDAIAYESVMLYMLAVWTSDDFSDAASGTAAPKSNALALGFSRDGFHISRLDDAQEPFIGRGDPESWNEGNVQSVGGGVIVIGPAEQEQLAIYFTARENRVTGENQIERWGRMGRARIRRDGFVSLDAGPNGGSILTRPLRFDHEDGFLFVNCDTAGGDLSVEIADREGFAIPGFSFADCRSIQTDSTRHQVVWRERGSLANLASRPFRVRFKLTSGRLFSFWVSSDNDGRSNGFLAAGGPGYPGYRDTTASALTGSFVNLADRPPFRLLSSSPNPFSDRATIRYRLDRSVAIQLDILDVRGRRIALLLDATQGPGDKTASFDGSDLVPGVYFCRLRAGAREDTIKLLRL